MAPSAGDSPSRSRTGERSYLPSGGWHCSDFCGPSSQVRTRSSTGAASVEFVAVTASSIVYLVYPKKDYALFINYKTNI